MARISLSRLLLVVLLAACGRAFEVKNFPSPESLYQASLREYERGKWERAVLGFEELTLQLSPRDTLLPRSFYYLATAYERRGEHLLAAQSYARLVETFPTDTLADDALFEAAQAYQRMWKKPELDPQYGESALQTYRMLLSAYPDSPRKVDAEAGIARLNEWFATKDFENGMHYFRRKAYDPAILYFKDVVARYPQTDAARRSGLQMLESYGRVRYKEEAAELCTTLRQTYPTDKDVRARCGAPAPAAAAAAASVPPDSPTP